jgi:hypothetical protein
MYDLSKFEAAAGPISAWCTNTAKGGQRYKKQDPAPQFSGSRVFAAFFEANTVCTFEVEGVDTTASSIAHVI